MKKKIIVVLAAAALLAACGDSESPAGGGGAAAKLTFRGDGTFTPHDGQALRAALMRKSSPTVLDRKSTTVAGGTFSIVFDPALEPTVYQVHYWVDSNFGGGAVGACDPKANDHQWSVEVPAGETTHVETHSGATTVDVCATFTWSATYTGNFSGTHATQTLTAKLVRVADDAVLDTQSATVAATNPSFTLAFAPALVRGVAYKVVSYADNSAVGPNAGVCDAADHQWSYPVPDGGSVVVAHELPNATVCATYFP